MRPMIAAMWMGIVLVTTACADDPPDRQKRLEETVRQVEKDIEEVRGLKFKAPVKASVIARPKDATREVQGYYSTKDKALFVYDDVAGNYERGVLIHEMVHALQDQHFKLDKLHQPIEDDAELARAALIEGDATLTMIELLKKEQPRVAAMLDTPIEKARNFRNWFLYAQGARYVQALKKRGGWDAVNRAYRFTPDSTAQILFPDERISVIDLGPGTTRGAYKLVEQFAGKPAAADVLKLVSGWRGDREVLGKKGRAWIVAFDTAERAEQFQTALKQTADKSDLIAARGSRVYHITGDDPATARELLERLEGPLRLEVFSTSDKKWISFGEMIERLLKADIVCIGETHDSDLHHRVQAAVVKGLFARDERLGVGMEMFQRPYQEVIDRYFAGKIDEPTFLKETEYRQRWGYEWSMYQPIVEFCRRNGVPLAALNLPRELTQRISKVGHSGLSDDEKQQVGDVDYQVKAHRDHWYERLAKMHGQTNVPEEQKERSYQVMTTWDGYMAESTARFQKERGVRRMVVLAGSGHVERGFGIPDRAAKRTGGKAVTVGVAVGDEAQKRTDEALTDYIVVVKTDG